MSSPSAPYRKFAFVAGCRDAEVGEPIPPEVAEEPYLHAQLVDCALTKNPSVSLEDVGDNVVTGWLYGDGSVLTAQASADVPDHIAGDLEEALRRWAGSEFTLRFEWSR
jgi:hypothetical protein